MKSSVSIFVLLALACAQEAPQQSSDQALGENPVEIIFLNVGQGDAIVIRSPEGRVALVDAGQVVNVANLLRQHGVEAIDIAIASHAHADHISGMENVIRSIPISYYMDNGVPHNTSAYVNLMMTLQASSITYLQAAARTIELGSVTLRVLEPPPWVNAESEQNNSSIGLVVEYGEFKVLLTGDSEIGELNHFLQVGVPDVTVLKAAHHGSRNGVSPAWLSATKPEVVVISSGLNNQYGHPDPWALRYYEAVASEVYRTDWHGEVTVYGQRDGSYVVSVAQAMGSM
jgi:beta-lactamase superfamily II metal-dependent hydrolase